MNVRGAIFAMLAFSPVWAQSTVVMSGRITDAATGLPVDGAEVTLTQSGGTREARQIRFADAAGNYSFEEVAPGAGQIAIQAEGFIPFWESNPDATSIQIPKDRAEQNFKLTPAASITGGISGMEADKPGVGATLRLLHEDYTDGVRRFAAVSEGASSTESWLRSDGSFKFDGLRPGRYIIAVVPNTPWYNPLVNRARLGCTLLGPCDLTPSLEAQRRSEPTEGYTITYYPGVTDFAGAAPITLAAGDRRTVDFKVTKQPLFHVSGEIEATGAEPKVEVLTIERSNAKGIAVKYGYGALAPGRFDVGGLPAGQYSARAGAPPGLEVEFSFSISDHDVEGLRLVPHPPPPQLEVSGAFEMQSGGMANSGSRLPAGLSVQFAFPEPGGRSDSIPASDDGAFWLTGLPGDYSIEPVVPAGYAVTEVRYGGGNYLNRLISIRGDLIDSSLTIVLTDQPGSVGGSIIDGDQKPVPARIALAPDPLPADFDFRAIRVVKNDDQGAFAFAGVAPGRYKAVALTGDDRKRDHDLALLGPKLDLADAFEVVAGQSVTLALHP